MASSTNNTLYSSTPIRAVAQLTTANPNRDGTGVLVLLTSAGGSIGERVDWIHFAALGTTTAGMIRLFQKTATGVYTLLLEIPVPAVTASGTDPAWSYDYFPAQPTMSAPSPLTLIPTDALYVSTEKGEPFAVTAFGGTL